MSNPTENGGRAAPVPTVMVERRGRFGCLGAGLLLALMLSLLVNCTFIASQSAGLVPRKLQEVYVAGAIAATTSNKIAVVEVEGVIIDGVVDHAIKQLKQARDDGDVKAVVLRIDSPGGTVSGADRIWREVELLVKGTDKKGTGRKPVVASMGGTAASGGYYVAAPADRILAEPTTLTGSIGVILEIPQIHELLDKVGVEFATITTGEYKDMGSMFRPMTDAERDRWRAMIDASYQRFVNVVAAGRKLPRADALALANGKVYTTDEAKALKLIDGVGYLDDAIQDAQRRANIRGDVRVVRYARALGLEALLGAAAESRQPPLKIDAAAILNLRTPQMLYLAR